MTSSIQPQRLNRLAVEFAHRDFARVLSTQTVADAIDTAQTSQIDSRIVYFYVVDAENRLQGVVPTRQLLLSPPTTPITEIMIKNVIRLPADATWLDACELFVLHRLMALPIVDEQRRVVGVVDIEQYADEVRDMDVREQAQDIFQLIGVRLNQMRGNSVLSHFSNRFPWLLCNIGGGLACAVVAGQFQATLDQIIVLALFIPVVLALAESVSIQSLTLTLQAQHGNRVNWSRVLQLVGRELPLGLLLGGACGSLVGLAAWLWKGEPQVALCLLASITITVTTSTLFGLLVPSILMSAQRDPQVASGPITLASADVTTTLVYLGLATWWLV
ncbi:MAG TPA: magnesium transporter [Pirellulaceae bacterium]|nr:magnesium transporter [Pirellulaceae bacterium]